MEQNNDLVFYKSIPLELSKPKVKKQKNCIAITFEYDKEKYLVVTKDNENIYSAQVSEIVVDNNNLSCIKKLNDMLGQARIISIDCDTGNVVSELAYLTEPKVNFAQELLPFAMFEAIRTGNGALARQFITTELSGSLDDEHLLSYFGDFDTVFPLTSRSYDYVLLLDTTSKQIKVYNVEFKDNKISNVKLI